MAMDREPLTQWRFPHDDVLRGEVVDSGRPPFAPFPTVETVVHGALCPVAVLHDLLHGIDYALTLRFFEEREQDLMQNFIVRIKSQLRTQAVTLPDSGPAQLEFLRTDFLEYSNRYGFRLDAQAELWDRYVEPWFIRKIQNSELNLVGNDIYFQLYVANPKTRFTTDTGGNIHYPIRGWLDEVDFTRRQLILRTIKGLQGDENPPLLSDYRIWLFKKMLETMNPERMPTAWRGINFNDYSLIVETPYRDFTVENNEQEFNHFTHQSMSWIHDIGVAKHNGILREVYDGQQCIPDFPHEICEYPFRVCFRRNFTHPTSRTEMRRNIQSWFRLILWEKMWEGDKWHYQLLLLEQNDLEHFRLVELTRVVSYHDNELQLELLRRESSTFRGYERCTIVPFGTVHCGLRIDGTLSNISGNVLTFQMNENISSISEEALLLVSPETISPMMKSEPPTFIKKNIQKDLFYLQHFGTDDDIRAQTTSLIQLIEAIYGDRELRRGPL